MVNNLYRKTPVMGWASWNCFRTDISEERMKEQMDALVNTGLAECGYEYANMDDGFFGGRGEDGQLKFHKERFPNGIKVIADYAHKKNRINEAASMDRRSAGCKRRQLSMKKGTTVMLELIKAAKKAAIPAKVVYVRNW